VTRFEFEVKPAGELGPGETPLDEWALLLPRCCDSWEIGEGTLAQVLSAAREFRAGLDVAVRRLERAQAEDGNEPSRYAAARASVAETLRALSVSATQSGDRFLAGIASWQAEMLECPSPFASMASVGRPGPDRSPGCYEASFGWVHVRPACRCAR
jgi:hypothetical protein